MENKAQKLESWMTNIHQTMTTIELEHVLEQKQNEYEALADSIGRIENELFNRKNKPNS